MKKATFVKRFNAEGSDGKSYIINEFIIYDETSYQGGAHSSPEESRILKLENGTDVERVSRGKYKIHTVPILGDIELSSDDPEAP